MCKLCDDARLAETAIDEAIDEAKREVAEQAAQRAMDEAVKRVIDFYRMNAGKAREVGATMGTAVEREALAKLMAGSLMFNQDPAAIAYGLALMAMRYAALLEQWAELYVTYDESADLESITTAEARIAATEQSEAARTGMYL